MIPFNRLHCHFHMALTLSSKTRFSKTLAAVAFSMAMVVMVVATPALAQDSSEPSANANIDDSVAAALRSRAQVLLDSGDAANGKKLFIESLERSPSGPSSESALAGLRAANKMLGITNLEDGRPKRTGNEEPLDPYVSNDVSNDVSRDVSKENPQETPLDPYAPVETPLDPYQDRSPVVAGPVDGFERDDEPNRATSRGLMAWGAGFGFSLGMAIGGPTDGAEEIRGAALALGLVGIGGGLAGGYVASHRYPLSRGQVAAIASAGNWGMWNFAFLGDVFTGENTDTNDIYNFIGAGGVIGAGAGILWATKKKPSEGTVALVNSASAYGTTAGLLLGVALDPPRPEAYSINAVIGSGVGLAAGLWASSRLKMSRGRTLRIDLGAAAGVASTWALLYPLISDPNSNNDEQFAGLFSTITMAGGIGLAYYLTRHYDDNKNTNPDSDPYSAPLALIRRSGLGRWSLGSPLLRPMATRAESSFQNGFSLGFDVAAGRF